MQCPHCHADDQEGRFCVKCGQSLSESTTESSESSESAPVDTSVADTNNTAEPVDATNSETQENPTETTAQLTDAERQAHLEEWARDNDEFFDTFEAEEAGTKKPRSRLKKVLAGVCLVCGILLACGSSYYLFIHTFGDNSASDDAQRAIADADIVAPDGEIAADSIVGHWRHYNTGSIIEKIGNDRYRWTIEDAVYELRYAEEIYTVEDTEGNLYQFSLTGPDLLKLISSTNADGGLIKNPIFESGFTAGRVGQDGSMAKNLQINYDAFNILGKTYAEIAGTYGPGALSVIGDNQYLVFSAHGGNFAVQFTGATVPLSEQHVGNDFQIVKLTSDNTGYPSDGTTDNSGNTGGDTTQGGTTDNTTPSTGGNASSGNAGTTDSKDKDKEEEEKKYTVEIPDMPTFPSNSAVATGVIWADLGFLVKNAPDSMTVGDLSAILGISLEVGTADYDASGFYFYGMDDGYFAGTFEYNGHSYNLSGYGKNNLDPGKTLIFIQQLS